MARIRRDDRGRGRSGGSFEDFIRELLDFYDHISNSHYIPESSEIKEQMDDIADKHGVELYREGTNRSIYKNGNYVYKCAHKLDAAEDNIAELQNTEYILNHRDADMLRDHFALSEQFMGGSEYILEQEFITPLHEEANVSRNENEAEKSLEILMKNPDAYENLISKITDYFVISDVSPRSIFNFGIKTDYNGDDVLAILDYGYFIPKDRGDLLCPECGKGSLKYDIKNIRTNGESKKQVINRIKSSVMERYICTNKSCPNHNTPPLAGRVIEMYNEGLIDIVDDRGYDRRSSSGQDRLDRRPRRDTRSRDSRDRRNSGGFNR